MDQEKRKPIVSNAGAWGMNVVSSVGIIMVNKVLMSAAGYGFGFGTKAHLLIIVMINSISFNFNPFLLELLKFIMFFSFPNYSMCVSVVLGDAFIL